MLPLSPSIVTLASTLPLSTRPPPSHSVKSSFFLKTSVRRTLCARYRCNNFGLVSCGVRQLDSDSGVPSLPAISPPVVAVLCFAFSSLQTVQADTASKVCRKSRRKAGVVRSLSHEGAGLRSLVDEHRVPPHHSFDRLPGAPGRMKRTTGPPEPWSGKAAGLRQPG